MCFSAPASFIAAATVGTAGAVCLARVSDRKDWPLAAVPVFFAIQQAIEGLLWINLEHGPASPATAALTDGFLTFALVFWPVYAPMAALAAEPDRTRRFLIGLCLGAGLAVAAYFFMSLDSSPRTATIEGAHIVYSADPDLPLGIRLLYPIATCLSLLLSSHPAIAFAGAVIFIGSVVSYWMYWNAFTSVWCFFAAGASALVILHFENARRATQERAHTS
jgi:hypothetical protein